MRYRQYALVGSRRVARQSGNRVAAAGDVVEDRRTARVLRGAEAIERGVERPDASACLLHEERGEAREGGSARGGPEDGLESAR